MQIQFKGPAGIVGLVVALLLVGLRFATLGESTDPDLEAAIRAELTSVLGSRTLQDLEAVGPAETMSTETAQSLLERADPEGIRIHTMKVSAPLLSFSSSEEVVVLVVYTLPGEPRREDYWLFRHSTLAGWRFLRRSTVLSYYMNFF